MEKLYQLQIAYFKGGRTQIATKDPHAMQKMLMWHEKGYVNAPEKHDEVMTCEVVEDRYLTYSFYHRR